MIYAENILICIAGPLIVALAFTKDKARRFIAAFITGMVTCLIAAYIGGFFELKAGLGMENTAIFISPVVEEILKLIPMLLYLSLFEPSEEGMILTCTGIGTGFATFENCCQLLSAGSGSLPYIMVRGFAVGVMHIVSLLAMTFAFVVLRRRGALSVAVIIGALSMSTSFHGLYNLLVSSPGASTYIGYCLPLSVAVMLYLMRKRIAR